MTPFWIALGIISTVFAFQEAMDVTLRIVNREWVGSRFMSPDRMRAVASILIAMWSGLAGFAFSRLLP